MKIHGSFVNEKGQTVTVVMVTGGSAVRDVEIGTDESGMWFSDDSVDLTCEMNDTLDVLVCHSATVRLLVNDFVADLFQANARDAAIEISRDGRLLFSGYIEPMSYSQPYNEVLDELTLNCIDALSALQYSKYKGIGWHGVSYGSVKRGAKNVLLSDVVTGIVSGCCDGTISSAGVRLLYDGSKCLSADEKDSDRYGVLASLSISELLFLGDSEDDTWSQFTVLEELLKWLNLHLVQEGRDFYLFSWESVRGGSITWKDLIGGGTEPTSCSVTDISTVMAGDCDTQLTIGEVFNQIVVTCETKRMERLIESPLDGDSLLSPFTNMQKYMTEYSSDGEGEHAQSAFIAITNDRSSDYSGAKVTDWFVRVMNHPRWQFFCGGKDVVTTWCQDNKNQERAVNALSRSIGSALLSFGKIEKKTTVSDNSPVSHVDMENYLLVSVNGNCDDSEAGARPSDSDLLGSIPVARYRGNESGGSFSPADDESVNYIVVSGSVVLNPVMKVSVAWPEREGKVIHKGLTVPSRENKDGRYYTRKYWKSSTPRSEAEADVSTGVTVKGEVGGPSIVDGVTPFTGTGPEEYEYKWSAVGDGTDTISKVAVLACMLRIGDKVLVEKEKGETLGTGVAGTGTGALSDFVWLEYKDRGACADDGEYYRQCFYIGIDPKIGDKLTGSEFPVQNNIDYRLGIDAVGMAIPIRRSDRLSGDVEFEILGPVNTLWGEISRRHPSFWRHTKWSTESVALLAHVSSVMVKTLEMKVYSDNGLESGGEGDLVYMSDTDERYVNKKDDIEMKLCSGLTASDLRELGVSGGVMMNTPTAAGTGLPVTTIYDANQDVEAKAEQLYVDSYYKELHEARVELEQTLEEDGEGWSRWHHYRHPALGKEMVCLGMDRNLMGGTARLKLKDY